MSITKQLDYVRDNIDALTQRFDGKYVVVSEKLDVSPFESLDEAYLFGAEKYGLGNFLLQLFSTSTDHVYIINQTITTL